MKTVAFFNNKGGVGKTSLVYHLAWMYSQNGLRVLAVDLDPQSNLSSMFLDDERLVELWNPDDEKSIYNSMHPLMNRTGDISAPFVEMLNDNLGLIVGNLKLSRCEDLLAENWSKCLDGKEDAFRVISAFYRIILKAAASVSAQIVLIDVGPNLGSINRSALISAGRIIVPMASDLFSLQGLENLGPTLKDWRKGWKKRLDEVPAGLLIDLPEGEMVPGGYVVLQHNEKSGRPVKAYQNWLNKIPSVYRKAVLDEADETAPMPDSDPYLLALLRHYRSLMPMAMTAHKPMFHLKVADGAIGSHMDAVQACYRDFNSLAKKIADGLGIDMNN